MYGSNQYFINLSHLTKEKIFLDKVIQKHFSLQESSRGDMRCLLISYSESKPIFIKKLIGKTEIKPLLQLSKYRSDHRSKYVLLDITIKTKHRGVAPSMMRQKLKNKRGLTTEEGIWLASLYPGVLGHQAIDLLGSIYSLECIPTIYKWGDKSYLSAVCPDVSDKMCGAPVVENEIVLSPRDFSDADILMRKIRTYETRL